MQPYSEGYFTYADDEIRQSMLINVRRSLHLFLNFGLFLHCIFEKSSFFGCRSSNERFTVLLQNKKLWVTKSSVFLLPEKEEWHVSFENKITYTKMLEHHTTWWLFWKLIQSINRVSKFLSHWWKFQNAHHFNIFETKLNIMYLVMLV